MRWRRERESKEVRSLYLLSSPLFRNRRDVPAVPMIRLSILTARGLRRGTQLTFGAGSKVWAGSENNSQSLSQSQSASVPYYYDYLLAASYTVYIPLDSAAAARMPKSKNIRAKCDMCRRMRWPQSNRNRVCNRTMAFGSMHCCVVWYEKPVQKEEREERRGASDEA
jgi:hypothetical protein